MSVYLQFDSSYRSNPYIVKNIGGQPRWVPNDDYDNSNGFPYQTNHNLVQTPSNYRVFYKQLTDKNNIRTIGFLEHCKERPENLTYSVECCMVTIPSVALVARKDENGEIIDYTSVLNEPYIYVTMLPEEDAEGDLIYSNNPNVNDATFIVWLDKVQLGTSDNSPPITNLPRPNEPFASGDLLTTRWITYKSCMITVMRLNLGAGQWKIRLYDRFGNDIILAESDNGGAGFYAELDPNIPTPINPLIPKPVRYINPPSIDPNLQTSILVGIKPNYPL